MREMMRYAWMLVVALTVGAGCNQRRGELPSETDDQVHLVIGASGAILHSVYPHQDVTLRVLAHKWVGQKLEDPSQLAPASGEIIAWSLINAPPGVTLPEPATVPTDESGVGEITFNSGITPNRSFQVAATAEGTDPVRFTIRVGSDSAHLEPLGSSPLNTGMNRVERLRVRLVRGAAGTQGGTAVPGRLLHVELVDAAGAVAAGAGLELASAEAGTVETDASGVATVRFRTGSVPRVPGYQIAFCREASQCPGIEGASVVVNVNTAAGSGGECRYFTDCAPGLVCTHEGYCETVASFCASDLDCPTGTVCSDSSRTCELRPARGCDDDHDCTEGFVCGAAGYCVPPDGCINDQDCDGNWTCVQQTGACLPPADASALDIRGLWATTYHFDLSDTLPGFVTDVLGPVVDFLNLIFHSQINVDIPIIGDILEVLLDGLVEAFVPDWVETLVTVLADFIHLFEDFEVQGEMLLMQSPEGPPLGFTITGQEDWVSAQMSVVSLCPGGPAQFQQDPSCGRLDLILDPTLELGYSNAEPRVGVEMVTPFNGQIIGVAHVDHTGTLRIYNRDVKLAFTQLVNVILDIIVSLASNGQYTDFEAFLIDIVPCADFQAEMDDLVYDLTDGDITSLPGVETLCVAAATAATSALSAWLGDVRMSVLRLRFDATALVHNPEPLNATVDWIGNPADPAAPGEGVIAGTSSSITSGDLVNSWWYAVRAD